MLSQYGPDLLVTSQNSVALAEDLVAEWLKLYMFKGQADAEAKGKAIGKWLSAHNTFKAHARPISRDTLRSKGLTGVRDLEHEHTEQDLFLSVYHAIAHTFFSNPSAAKIVENHQGKAYIRHVSQPIQIVQVPVQGAPPVQPPLQPQQPTAPTPAPQPQANSFLPETHQATVWGLSGSEDAVVAALTLVRANKSRGSGHWSDDDYDVYDGDRVIGRIMRHPQAPEGEPWFWTITARRRTPSVSDRGYAASREQAMVDFKARWCR